MIVNAVKAAAADAVAHRAATRHGTISSYDPANCAVKVLLQPDGTLTGWMPLKCVAVGNGFGIISAPNIGDAVEIDFQEDDKQTGSVGHRFFNNQARPMNVPAGETWIMHQTGSSVKLTTDGKITMTDAAGSIVQCDNGGNVNITATTVAIKGNVTVSGSITAQGDVIGDGTSLHTHTHSGVQPGSGTSGAPV